jgi:CRISPR/Cas system-associated exonuclease Cas4 (RecB family)
VDVLDESGTDTTTPISVERKRATSGRVYRNDEIQVTAYGLLLEATSDAVETVDYGIVYLYETDERHRIELTPDRREAVHSIREKILQLEPNDPPSPVENRNKCCGCSVRHYCQPETETYLDSKPDYVEQVVNGGENDVC